MRIYSDLFFNISKQVVYTSRYISNRKYERFPLHKCQYTLLLCLSSVELQKEPKCRAKRCQHFAYWLLESTEEYHSMYRHSKALYSILLNTLYWKCQSGKWNELSMPLTSGVIQDLFRVNFLPIGEKKWISLFWGPVVHRQKDPPNMGRMGCVC